MSTSVTGRVLDQSSNGIAGLTVVVRGESDLFPSDLGSATTAGDGHFTVPIAADRMTDVFGTRQLGVSVRTTSARRLLYSHVYPDVDGDTLTVPDVSLRTADVTGWAVSLPGTTNALPIRNGNAMRALVDDKAAWQQVATAMRGAQQAVLVMQLEMDMPRGYQATASDERPEIILAFPDTFEPNHPGTANDPDTFLLLAPTLGLTDDAEPLENVLVTRDATAALAWAVEQTVQGAADVGVDGYEGYLARLRQDGQAPPPAPAPDMPSIAYTLEHPPPDNWIPLVPVLPAIGRAAVFRRGTMDIPGPHGTVLALAAHAELLGPGEPFYLTDRVVTPIGVGAQRTMRRTRLPDGSTVVWLANRSGPGRGPGSSGLGFDYLRDGMTDESAGG